MKHPIHSAEWLTDTRKRANLTMKQLAELTGLHSQSIYNIESSKYGSSQEVWNTIDRILYDRVPAAYVDEDALIATARAYENLAHREGNMCRLYYKAGIEGVAFIGVRSMRDEDIEAPYVTLSWADAVKLLEAQKQALERE